MAVKKSNNKNVRSSFSNRFPGSNKGNNQSQRKNSAEPDDIKQQRERILGNIQEGCKTFMEVSEKKRAKFEEESAKKMEAILALRQLVIDNASRRTQFYFSKEDSSMNSSNRIKNNRDYIDKMSTFKTKIYNTPNILLTGEK